MKLLTKQLEKRFTQIGYQGSSDDPLFIAKFFNPCGAGTWYATEYSPKTRNFFGYVAGLGYDEWGYFSLDELSELRLPYGLRIERDKFFDECRSSTITNN